MTDANFVYSKINTSVGEICLTASSKGLCQIALQRYHEPEAMLRSWLQRHFRQVTLERNDIELALYVKQLRQYLEGTRKNFIFPVDLWGTSFQKRVWQEIQTITYGQVLTYKEIANQIGHPQAVRAIGGASNRNPLPIVIPCHRVIGSNGSLVGYSAGLEVKQQLLMLEGYMSGEQSTVRKVRAKKR